MINKKYYKLCVRAISNQISENQKAQLEKWLNQSNENMEYFNQLKSTWQQQQEPQFTIKPDVDNAWLKFEQSIKVQQKIRKSLNIIESIKAFLTSVPRPAFAIVCTLFILLFAITSYKADFFRSEFKTVQTQNAERQRITLADGSIVHLNCGSVLKYSRNLSDSIRQVHLQGEAFFEITKDTRPFIVTTENAQTTVLGTKFNVWGRNNITRVKVKEGRVRLSAAIEHISVVELTKNEMSEIDHSFAPDKPQKIEFSKAVGWMNNKFIFKRTGVIEIIDELERFYDVSIRVEHDEIYDKTLTATFDNLPVEAVIKSICLSLKINYRMDSKSFVLFN